MFVAVPGGCLGVLDGGTEGVLEALYEVGGCPAAGHALGTCFVQVELHRKIAVCTQLH